MENPVIEIQFLKNKEERINYTKMVIEIPHKNPDTLSVCTYTQKPEERRAYSAYYSMKKEDLICWLRLSLKHIIPDTGLCSRNRISSGRTSYCGCGGNSVKNAKRPPYGAISQSLWLVRHRQT